MLGAYGLQLPDVASSNAARLLRDVPSTAPVLRVLQSRADEPAGERPTVVEDDRAEHDLADGRGHIVLTRDDLTANFTRTGPAELPPDHLVHPYLSVPAAVVHRWLGHDVLHAGAFELDGGAWAVLGTRDSGKSSLMAQLHLMGLRVLTDDLVVVDRGTVMTGPGLVDLRASAAEHLGIGTAMGRVGLRERWRIEVGPAEPLPLRGWLILDWGELSIERVPGTARLPLLMTNVALRLPPSDPVQFFDLAARPVLRWRRPRDWDLMEVSTRRLLDGLAGQPG